MRITLPSPAVVLSLLLAALLTAPLAGPAAADWVVVSGPTGVDLHDVATGVGNAAIAVGDAGTILRTTNAGATWAAMASPTTQDLISINAGGSHFRAGGAGGHVPQSFDAGLTWSFFGVSPSSAPTVTFSNGTGVSWAATGNGFLFLTTDAGVSWATRLAGPATALRAGNAFGSNGPGHVVGDAGVMWLTSDGSAWSPVASGTTADLRDCVGVSDNPFTALAVGTNGTLLKSTDRGVTWSPRTSGTTEDLNAVIRAGSPLAYVVGDHGTILRSTDDGETWCRLPAVTSANLRGATFYGGEAIAVGDGGTILRTVGGGGVCGGAVPVPEPAADPTRSDTLRVSPNPTASRARVEWIGPRPHGAVEVRVVDVTGRVVEGMPRTLRGDASLDLDVSSLPAGIYWITARDERGISVRSRLTVLR